MGGVARRRIAAWRGRGAVRRYAAPHAATPHGVYPGSDQRFPFFAVVGLFHFPRFLDARVDAAHRAAHDRTDDARVCQPEEVFAQGHVLAEDAHVRPLL